MAKLTMNSAIGLWNRNVRYAWTARETTLFDDVGRVDVVSSPLGSSDAIPTCKAKTQLLSYESCYPIGLIALQWECCQRPPPARRCS
jgi:hypothetical protein